MDKISNEQVGQLTKQAAAVLRALSEENVELKKTNDELAEKVASFEKKDRAEKIAHQMEVKGIDPEKTFQEKVAFVLGHENIAALEQAIGLVASQTKLASIHDDRVTVESDPEYQGDQAAENFANSLATLD